MRDARRFIAVDPTCIEDAPALSIGLHAHTGQGKTESSLRLAVGIRSITGRRIVFVDCDNGRGLHYLRGANPLFKGIEYIDFTPPYGAEQFVALLEQFENEHVILVIDNMTQEHEGEGGLLDTKEAAMYDRNGEYKESRTAVAWNKAKEPHKHLVRVFPRVNRRIPIIVTWRAQDKVDWNKKDRNGKISPENQGEMPIGSKDLPYEMTATYLLPAGSKGAPCLNPTERGEQLMTKIPRWFEGIIKPGEKITEKHGEAFARWAFGEPAAPPVKGKAPPAPSAEDEAAIVNLRERLRTAESSDDVAAIGREVGRLPKGHPIRVAVNEDFKRAKARCEGLALPGSEPPAASA